jgi:2-polyprenyl-6-methoxyphenol hydroxylase-like FAD-dependent oxidoreductase/SAM-dependent methyltransferase
MTEHAVVIAGGGPTGLMLAGELALAGVDVVIVERRVSQDVDGSRAGGLHSRTIEVLDQRGIAERFLAAGSVAQVQGYAGISLDISDLPTRHNYGLALWQSHFEPILADWVGELGVPTLRGQEVVGFAQDNTGVDVEVSGDTSLRAEFLVGCDGGRSLVRKTAGIDFAGLDASTSWLIAEVEMEQEPQLGMRPEGGGIGPVNREQGGGPFGVVVRERHVDHSGEPTLRDLSEALVLAYGTDYGVHSPTRISRFTDMARQAVSYRRGRVLLAGDAAHVHPPQGGQGLNTGVQDAVNLGWKLAQVVNKTSPESLLETYHAERHPVGARVLHNTMAQVALSSPGDRHQALRDTMAELLSMDEPRRHIAGMLSGLDIHYDLGEGHPLLGRRMPDLDLQTADGPTRVFTLLHDARPVLLNLGAPGGFDISPWANRVRLVDAVHDGAWELPLLGEVAAPPAVLIRPDGHVAWAGELTDPELPRALVTWFGAAAQAAKWDARYSERDGAMWSGRPNGRLVAEVADLTPGRALDVGCGEGADAIWLARRGWTVTAIDISEVATSRAREAVELAGAAVDWVCGDALQTPFPARSFDLVSMQYPALPNAAGDAAVRALLDTVRPGGLLLAVYHDLDDEHRAHMKSEGFDPADYVGAEELGRLLGDDFTIELQVEPRIDPPPGTPHVADVVLRARRR